ncbi:MAG: hypothetical protein ABEJ95_05055 [Candidatus Nanohalobium sp.]
MGVGEGKSFGTRISKRIRDSISQAIPSSLQSEKKFVHFSDPLGLAVDFEDVESLSPEQKKEVKNSKGEINEYTLAVFADEEIKAGDPEDWVEKVAYGEIKGFEDRFRTTRDISGTFKQGYIDENQKVFIQAPRRAGTFQESLEHVRTWKENKETLDEADKYLDQILSKKDREKAFTDNAEIKVDYGFLRENEESLRKIVNGGIKTPSEEYDTVITSRKGAREQEPLPVLVGEYNDNMLEEENEKEKLENYEEIKHREKVLGMYMDALIKEDVFEGVKADYWMNLGSEREGTKNMFYDPEEDTVGVTDLGEHQGNRPEEIPDIDIDPQYDRRKIPFIG